MDFDILYAIQNLRCAFLDSFILGLTWLVGDYGQLWAVVGAVMLLFKKTRKCGIVVLVSYALVFLGGQFVLKDLIARERPCVIDQTVELIVARKTSYSCPSTHTAWAFAAATSIFLHFKKWGIALFAVAAVIGFSRLYLFMHFPTDVLFGAVLGAALAIGAYYLVNVLYKKKPAKEENAK